MTRLVRASITRRLAGKNLMEPNEMDGNRLSITQKHTRPVSLSHGCPPAPSWAHFVCDEYVVNNRAIVSVFQDPLTLRKECPNALQNWPDLALRQVNHLYIPVRFLPQMGSGHPLLRCPVFRFIDSQIDLVAECQSLLRP